MMNATRPVLAVACFAFAAAANPTAVLAAGPANVNSCTTITSPGSYVLTKSITASGDCFAVRANDVTLDFDGFNATGDGTGAGMTLDGRGIVVRNGTLRGFGVGISIVTHSGTPPDFREGVVIDRMQVLDMTNFGIGGAWGTVRDSFFAGNGNTSIGLGAGPSLITGNRIVGNARAGVSAGAGSTITGNVISYNTALPSSVGLFVQCPSLVMGNTIVGQAVNVVTSGAGCVMDHNAVGP